MSDEQLELVIIVALVKVTPVLIAIAIVAAAYHHLTGVPS